MAEQTFNEAEQYLLQNWQIGREVEDSLEEVRAKYQELCEQIAEGVCANHEKLTVQIVQVRNFAGAVKSGVVAIGRSDWPAQSKLLPTAFWVENLRLEVLVDPEGDAPVIGFWLQWDNEEDDELYKGVEESIRKSAQKVFSAEQLTRWHIGDNKETPLVGRQLGSKETILKMISNNSSGEFADLLTEQFEELLTLLPAIEDVLSIAKTKAKG